MEQKFINVKGINTSYREGGRGDPIVLIHGGQYGANSSSSYCWSMNIKGLSEYFHVYAIDKFGMGDTDIPQSDAEYVFNPTLTHIQDFLDTVGIEEAALVGHSRGALPAVRIAVDHPDRVKAVIVVNSNTMAPTDPSTKMSFYEDMAKRAAGTPTLETAQVEAISYSYKTKHITEEYQEELFRLAQLPKLQEAKAKMKKLAGKLFNPSINKAKEQTLDMIRNGRLKVPTLIIWGMNDPSANVKLGLSLLQIVAASSHRTQFHVINEAGHFVFREQPEEFNRSVLNFVKNS
ncbi:MAG: alpha/beta hydrolase [Thaumarchaeota archaeon]|nr:alpha/beta hydrolase [Nitrososphaerota archaeon]